MAAAVPPGPGHVAVQHPGGSVFACVEIAKDGQYAAVVGAVVLEFELGEDGGDVFFDAAVGQVEPFGDGHIGPALGQQAQDLPLTVRQPRQAFIGIRSGEELAYDLGVEGRAAGRDPAQRRDETRRY